MKEPHTPVSQEQMDRFVTEILTSVGAEGISDTDLDTAAEQFVHTYVHRPPAPPPPAPRCGFPTQSGAECRNLVAAWGDLCRVHQTDESEPW